MLGQLWILSMLSFILEWRHSSISFSLKNGFCKFTWKTIALMRFHVLVLALNHESVFSRSNDVTSPHSLLRDVTPLLILIENVVLVVPQEKPSFAIVFITLLWAQSKKTGYRYFFTLWHIGNNNQPSNLSQEKMPKDLK